MFKHGDIVQYVQFIFPPFVGKRVKVTTIPTLGSKLYYGELLDEVTLHHEKFHIGYIIGFYEYEVMLIKRANTKSHFPKWW
jgi:hypothetical protein